MASLDYYDSMGNYIGVPLRYVEKDGSEILASNYIFNNNFMPNPSKIIPINLHPQAPNLNDLINLNTDPSAPEDLLERNEKKRQNLYTPSYMDILNSNKYPEY